MCEGTACVKMLCVKYLLYRRGRTLIQPMFPMRTSVQISGDTFYSEMSLVM